MRKEASSYMQMVFIVCCFATDSSKQRKDNQCLARYRWCLLSVYHDIVTCSQQKLKHFFFFLFHQRGL